MSRASKSGIRGLYKGADGTFRIDLRWKDLATGERRRYQEKLPPKTTAVVAKKRAQAILAEVLAGTFEPDREAPVTVRAAFDRYLGHCETHDIKSTRSRRTHALAICAFLGDSTPLVEIAAFDVERIKSHLRKTRSPATTNRHLATLKQLAAWAAREGLLDRGRAAELRDVRLLREPTGRVRWLSDAEQAVISAQLTGWLRPIVFTAIGTGARRTELAGLQWADVDRAHGQLVLRRTKNRKTRHVPIAPHVLEAIDAQPAGEPDTYVFHVPSRASRKPQGERRRSDEERRGDIVSKAWARFCGEHGLTDLHVHDLRHHAATMIRRAGHGLDVVAGILGHSDVRVAARYAHVGREELTAAVATASLPFALPLPADASEETANSAGS